MRPRILLSEATSLSARETITALGRAGGTVEVCAPVRWCLGAYSRWVDRVHVAPPVGADPAGYVAAIERIVAETPFDILLPVHEQAYLFAALLSRRPGWPNPRIGVPVAPLSAYAAVQTKSALALTLGSLGLPFPETTAAASVEELRRRAESLLAAGETCIVKSDAGTASVGLWRVRSRQDLDAVCANAAGGSAAWPAIVQAFVDGPLERAQAVFDSGRLVAVHAYRQIAPAPGGGDAVKESVDRPVVVSHLEHIGAHLRWHGALSFDYIAQEGDVERPCYLDANPRLVEPVNAQLGGADLAAALVRVALGESVGGGTPVRGRPGVRTRLGLCGLSERALATGRRWPVLADACSQWFRAGRYAGTVEELCPFRDDPWSAVPYAGALALLLVRPQAAAAMMRATVESYALGPRGYRYVRELAETPAAG